MELPWPYRRCIFCLREISETVPFSRAHLISESVGGFAWDWTHCKECNEQTGSEIESGILRDESVQFAVEALAGELPELAARFRRRMNFVAQSEHGVIEARKLADDDFRIRTTSSGGVRTSSPEDARASIEKRLKREHRSEEIAAALALFDQAEHGVPVEIAGETVVQSATGDFLPQIRGEEVTDAFPALVAFHFLALALRDSIYDERLNPLRETIKRGEPRSDWHVVERLFDRPYLPQHLVGFAQTEPYIVMRVQLFNWNVWRVHFPRLASTSEPFGYLFDLLTRERQLAAPKLSAPLALPE